MDPGADFSPPPPQSDIETLADVPWLESRKTNYLLSTDLKQEEMSHKHGACGQPFPSREDTLMLREKLKL